MKKIIVLSIAALLTLPASFAAPPKRYARSVKRTTYSRPKQQHFSFIPANPVFEPYNPPPYQLPPITQLSGQVTKQGALLPDLKAQTQQLPPMPKMEAPRVIETSIPIQRQRTDAQKSYVKLPKIRERSWVTGINANQAKPIASSLANFLATKLSPPNTTLLLVPPSKGQENNPFTPVLIEKLRLTGFGVVDSKIQAPQALILKYQISRLDDGIWAQLSVKDSEINKYYPLQNLYDLANASPFSERGGNRDE